MSGFILDDDVLDQISKQIPDLENLAELIFRFAPDFVSIKCPFDSNIPVAAVCLQDLVNTLLSERIALREYHSHRIWYREKCNPPNESLAIIMMQYYLDDAIARLYSSGEHLANAIICMLDITDDQLEPYRKKRTSQQAIIGHYLAKEQPQKPLTQSIIKLAKSDAWEKTMTYRASWVHEQPPSIKGLGITYRRKIRWVQGVTNDGKKSYTLGIGGGDGAEYSVDEIMDFVQPAIFNFIRLCDDVVKFYSEVLGKYGIVVTEKGVQFNLFGKVIPKPI